MTELLIITCGIVFVMVTVMLIAGVITFFTEGFEKDDYSQMFLTFIAFNGSGILGLHLLGFQ